MLKKKILQLAALGGLAAAGATGVSIAHAANPVGFVQFAPSAIPYTATTATRSVSFVARVPRSAFAPRDAQIDVTNISLGTTFGMEMLVGCSNDTGLSGQKSGAWPLSSADDFTLTCPIFTTVTAVQGGLGITN